jgi:hypothetical protein
MDDRYGATSIVLVLCVCVGCYSLVTLALIGYSIVSWRTRRRRGRRVELWSDDASRMQALLEAGASPAVAQQLVQGNKINAIKACRDEMELGLTEATQVADRYERALYRYEP